MKNSDKPQLQISLSLEHQQYQTDVAKAFEGLDVSFSPGLMRFSAMEIPMQLIIRVGAWASSSLAWDLLKLAIQKLYKKFTNVRITFRDSNSVMYSVDKDLNIFIIAVPEKLKDLKEIKKIDDLKKYIRTTLSESKVNDWPLYLVDEVFSFVKSYAFSRDVLVNDILDDKRVGNIHYGDLHAKFTTPSVDLGSISIPIVKNSSFIPDENDLLKDGDLIMADASEDYEGIGVTISVHGIEDKKVVGGLHTFVLRDKDGLTADYFRQYLFLNPKIRNSLQKVANGVSVYGISRKSLSKILLPVPPLPEQFRIVAVLETWDKAIEKLAKKIEIKRQIKKGLMQELLTGKKRLPGFKGEWKVLKLGEIATFKKGKGLPKNNIHSDGKHEAIHYGELFTQYDEYVENILSRTNSNDNVFISKKNDILMPTSDVTPRGLSTASYIDKDGVILGGDILVIRSSSALHGLFFCYIVSLNKKEVIKLVSGSTIFHLYGSDMARFRLNLPSIKEQESIVKVLIAADREIKELENKLSLLKDQKKYLLNNLITGAIRTPENLKITKLPC